MLDAWFVNEETRMAPSLEYAEIKIGEETGNYWGIIDTLDLVRAIEGVNILKTEGMIDEKTVKGLKFDLINILIGY